jgi:two-component system, response regulator FlrC
MPMNPFQVLLVEDDTDLREAISVTLRLGGVEHEAFECAEDALAVIDPEAEQMLVTDFRLPGMNGLQLLAQARERHPQLPVVVMTAYADTQLAVQALKGGARDFLIKPFMPQQLLEVIARHHPSPPAAKNGTDAEIIASDPAILAVKNRCERVAGTGATVLLTGESGVGKDVFAKQIHQLSGRNQKPYVAINCAAIPDNLLESTLFGYEKGAFTGAAKAQPGKFEQANGGTLFLDEIGEMPMELQAKLLRVLQDQVVERLGSLRSIHCDVRIVAATNQDLLQRVKDGRFREDLYFRLAVFPIRIPPLRERPADILPLAQHFLLRYGRTMGRQGMTLSPQSTSALQGHPWPGNVRELENAVQRALLLSDGPLIEPADIELPGGPGASAPPTPTPPQLSEASGTPLAYPAGTENPVSGGQDMETIEREHILKVLKQVGGNRKEAVNILGLSERALRYKLKAYKEAGFLFE